MAVTLANNHRNGAVASVGVAHVQVVATSKILCLKKKTTNKNERNENPLASSAEFCTVFNGAEVCAGMKE